jgi:hypothetical protein
MDRTKSLEPERPALVEGLKVRSIAYPVYVPDGNVNVADETLRMFDAEQRTVGAEAKVWSAVRRAKSVAQCTNKTYMSSSGRFPGSQYSWTGAVLTQGAAFRNSRVEMISSGGERATVTETGNGAPTVTRTGNKIPALLGERPPRHVSAGRGPQLGSHGLA